MKIIFTTTNKYKIKSAELVLNKYGIEVVGEDNIQNILNPLKEYG